jgi:septal ring factor EnvC (AmiA/AmiB activator)
VNIDPEFAEIQSGIVRNLLTVSNWLRRLAQREAKMGALATAWAAAKADLKAKDDQIASLKQTIAQLQTAQLDTPDQSAVADLESTYGGNPAPTTPAATNVTTFNVPTAGGAS